MNLTNVNFTREQINTLALGPNYAVEKDPKHHINELIIDTENAIRQMEPKMHNSFRYLATKKIKQIMTNTTQNTLHKRHHHNLKQIRNTLQQNDLTITRADKSKSTVIINKSTLKQKVDDFIQENHISCLNKDPTDTYQKQIQKKKQKCNTI
jgi:hypothetical protein